MAAQGRTVDHSLLLVDGPIDAEPRAWSGTHASRGSRRVQGAGDNGHRHAARAI